MESERDLPIEAKLKGTNFRLSKSLSLPYTRIFKMKLQMLVQASAHNFMKTDRGETSAIHVQWFSFSRTGFAAIS